LTKRRQEKQPLQYPSAGSAFKRPVGYYAGKLIQDAGLKGMRVGDAQISEIHSGFIINLGNATACDVIELIEKVKTR
jgi:UDP-N-acetylmuramate dehydrogenase